MFNYNNENSVYFTNNGHDFADESCILNDNASIRDIVSLCISYGKIEVYVNSS